MFLVKIDKKIIIKRNCTTKLGILLIFVQWKFILRLHKLSKLFDLLMQFYLIFYSTYVRLLTVEKLLFYNSF